MSREKSLVKNTFIIALGTFLPKLSAIITLPIITAGLTKQEYGIYDLISTLVSLFLPIVTLQIQSAAFRFLIDYREDETETKRIVTNIVAFIVPMSIVALVDLFLALYKLSSVIRLLICIYFFVDILVLTCQQIIRGLANNKLYSISAVVRSIANMILIVLMIQVRKQGLEGLLISLTIATTIGLGILVLKGKIIKKIDFSLLSKKTLKSLLSYSWPMIPNSLSSWVLNFSDRIVLTTFLGLEANALYAVANKIPSLFSTVQSTFAFAWQENASLAAKDEDAEVYYSSMFDTIFCILVGSMAILIAATPILFFILIRGDYGEAYYQMPILFLGVLFSSLSSLVGGIFIAHKKTKSVGMTTLVAAVLNLIIDLVFVNIIGVYAASVSTLVSYFILVLYRMRTVLKFQKIYYNIKKIIVLLGVLGVMCVLCWINTILSNVCNLVLGFFFAVTINYKVVVSMLNGVLSKLK